VPSFASGHVKERKWGSLNCAHEKITKIKAQAFLKRTDQIDQIEQHQCCSQIEAEER
jgi:hypothetical protein